MKTAKNPTCSLNIDLIWRAPQLACVRFELSCIEKNEFSSIKEEKNYAIVLMLNIKRSNIFPRRSFDVCLSV